MHQNAHRSLLPCMQHEQARAVPSAARGQGDELSLVYCPDCGMPAWVEWRDPVGSIGPAYVKVRCFARHWFLMLEEPRDG